MTRRAGRRAWVPAALPAALLAALAAAAHLAAAGPARVASPSKYESDLAAFVAEVDKTYPFFDLKGIRGDWAAAKPRLAAAAKACRSDTQFLGIVLEAFRCLRDAHMELEAPSVEMPRPTPRYYPGISFLPATRNRVIVMVPPQGQEKVLPTGTVVTRIDGQDARTVLETLAKKAWAEGGAFSSPQRARLFEYRMPLRGEQGGKHVLTFLEGGRERTVPLAAAQEARGWPHSCNLPAGLAQVGRSFAHARLPGGAGYMYIRRVDESAVPGITEALAKHPDAKGWVVDLRGNSGGGYDETLLGAVKAVPRPVAVLIDAGCISAGETLARDFVQHGGARLFGSKTAGSSSSKTQWAFPSGLATVRFSVRSRWRLDRKPIEFNGIDPDVEVEAEPEEASRGQDSVIARAEEYLRAPR